VPHVPAPAIHLTPTSGPPSTSVTAQVFDFQSGEQVKIYYAGAFVTSVIANVSGNGSAMFTVPNGTTGTNTVLAVGQSSGDQASAPFDQTPPPPSIQLLPNSGLPGTSVTATVTNFEAGEQVKIYYAGALQTSLIADVSGNGSAMFSVPNGTTGTNTVLAVGQSSGDQASAPFDQFGPGIGEHPIFKTLIQLIVVGDMIELPKTFALEDEVEPSGITSAEWILMERYRGGSQLDSWSQSDKATLMSAFRKAYDYSIPRPI
jgi:hypothetical protein